MPNFLSAIALRSVFVFASTAFSILVVMLVLNIITVDDVAVILKMSPEAVNALKLVLSRVQEVSGNIIDIISQLLNKLFSWAGVDVDLSKIKVDVGHNNSGSIPEDNLHVLPPSTSSNSQ
jgi:hypothetical protein